MKHVKRCLVMVILALFAFSPLLSIAAEKQWCLVKDKNQKCRIIKCDKATPHTVGSPYKTKDEAQKAKEKECPKPEKQKPPTKPPATGR